MITSELEYFDKDWEITVFPQPKAPGIAVVPPCTALNEKGFFFILEFHKSDVLTETAHLRLFDLLKVDDLLAIFH